VHQINDRLAAWTVPGEDIGPNGAGLGRTLDRLVELTLLRQEAEAQGLAQKPEVMRALQAARAEVLARALAQQIGEDEASPAPHLVRRYYDEHPEAFARRRVFHVQEIRAQASGDALRPVLAQLTEYRQPQALARALEKAGHRGVLIQAQVASDRLPLPQLQRLQKLSPGQPLLMEDGQGLRVWWVQASLEQPIDWEQAQPVIERMLVSKARAERVRAELQRLRERANIEFIGDFARWAPDVGAPAKATGEGAQGAVADGTTR
jgi:EpsD family peptidyl-prolyl cis-trans isomerase